MQSKPINLVIMPTSIEKGMAGTMRLRNFVKYLQPRDVTVSNIVPGEEEGVRQFGEATIYLLDNRKRSVWSQYKKMISILKACRKPGAKNVLLKYDTIHPPFHYFVVRYARKKLGYKVIMDVVEDYNTQSYNLGWKGNLRVWFSGFFQRHVNRYADGAIGISTYLMNFLGKRMKEEKLVHCPVAFDPDMITSRVRKDDDENIRVFYGGTFGEKDGMEFLLEGFARAYEKNPMLKLYLTGKASEIDARRFQALLENYPYPEAIVNLGFVSYEEYCDVLGKADILCMTRRNSAFANAGFPYKLGEFLATGKAVIVSRLDEVSRYLDENDCYFVTPESAGEITEGLLALTDKERREQLGNNGRQKAYANFNARIVTDHLYLFLQHI